MKQANIDTESTYTGRTTSKSNIQKKSKRKHTHTHFGCLPQYSEVEMINDECECIIIMNMLSADFNLSFNLRYLHPNDQR